MKRKVALIIAIVVAVGVCVGTVFAEQLINPSISLEGLSTEDKALKTKIAKYSDTKVDFRHNKQEIVQGKAYDISFLELNDETDPSKVIYGNNSGDEFEYDIETGKLYYATIDSNVVEKTDDSIDIEAAHKIALSFFPEDCDIKEYDDYSSREGNNGYYFCYTRYIGQYMTTDSFSITIGFDGSVVNVRDSTDEFDGKNIDFDEEFVNSKIQEFAKEKGIAQIQGDVILVSEGKTRVSCSFGEDYHNIIEIPLE